MQPQKLGKGKPICDLILQLLVAEVEESLDDQSLEHQNHIQRFASSEAFALGLAHSIGQNRAK